MSPGRKAMAKRLIGFIFLPFVSSLAPFILLPLLAGGLWWITASSRLIGPQYRNRWWEKWVMGALFSLALYFAFQAFVTLVTQVVNVMR